MLRQVHQPYPRLMSSVPLSPSQLSAPGTRIRPARPDDADAVIAIRNDAIRTSTALWIDTVPSEDAARAWAAEHVELGSMLVVELLDGGADPDGPADADLDSPGTDSTDRAADRPEPVTAPPGRVVGFASHAPLRPYDGYRWTAEDSVYLTADAQGRGLGRALLEALVPLAASQGAHSLIGMIEASNTASIALHERCGFTETGRIPQAGRKFDRWLDLVIMQRLL